LFPQPDKRLRLVDRFPKNLTLALFPFSFCSAQVLFAIFFSRLPFFSPNVVVHAFNTFLSGAMRAAKIGCIGFNAMPDNLAPAICTNRRKPMNRAFKTIENVVVSSRYYFKRQIIIVTANFALSHFSRTPYFILL